MEKTKIVKFTPANFLYSPLFITFAEHLPFKRNAVKFLVLQLDSRLSWKPYKNYLLHKLSSVCFIRRRLSHILHIPTMRTVYFGRFHCWVNHGIIFWGNTCTMCKVFLAQKKI